MDFGQMGLYIKLHTHKQTSHAGQVQKKQRIKNKCKEHHAHSKAQTQQGVSKTFIMLPSAAYLDTRTHDQQLG